jgi:hypothetical protein
MYEAAIRGSWLLARLRPARPFGRLRVVLTKVEGRGAKSPSVH